MITYPSSIKTDLDRLLATYSLREQVRQAHNYLGAVARSDPEKYLLSGIWKRFTREYFRPLQQPLGGEYVRLKANIRKAKYSDGDWQAIMDSLDESEAIGETIYGKESELAFLTTKAKSDELETLKRIDLAKILPLITHTYEDWTGYVETDANNILTVAANQIDFTNMLRNSNCSVVKDFTAGHFGATYTHDFDVGITDLTSGNIGVTGCGNDATPYITDDPIIICWLVQTGGNRMRLLIDDGATDEFATYTFVLGTFYNTIDRNATDTDMLIYSDAPRTNLLSTLSVSKGTSTFRYQGSGFNFDANAGSYTNAGSIYNLDINETGAVYVPKFIGMM